MRDALAHATSSERRDLGEIALLSAVSYVRLGDEINAAAAFREAIAHGISAMNPALEGDIEFHLALSALAKDDVPAAHLACLRGLEAINKPPMFPQYNGNIPVAHVVARIEELLGVIAAAQGRYADLIEHARRSLQTLDASDIRDIFQESFALKNASIIVRDFDLEDDARLLAARIESFPWTDDIRSVQFTTIESLGWCSVLRGDAVEALRRFRRAEAAATCAPERITIGVDRSLVAREFGHSAMVIEEVEHALDAAARYDWENAAGDTREALLFLAQASAFVAPVRARETLDRYTAIRNKMDGTFAARIEPRARAEESYTHGVVLRAEGRLAASAERLTMAFETWETIGFAWRAGRAALELAELDAGEHFRLAVRRELKRRPDSIFSVRARLIA